MREKELNVHFFIYCYFLFRPGRKFIKKTFNPGRSEFKIDFQLGNIFRTLFLLCSSSLNNNKISLSKSFIRVQRKDASRGGIEWP